MKNNIKNNISSTKTKQVSDKSFTATLLLSIFLGMLGIHRFYAGKVGTGLIWLFTGGIFGFGYVADIIIITSQSFDDALGKTIMVHN